MTDSLLAHLGHDLRNPGTTLVSCVELLRDVVHDPDGREAVEDAELALGQLQHAWARVDVLAGHFAPSLLEEVALSAIFEHVTKAHHATCSAPQGVTAPEGLRFVLDALLEATRRPTIEVRQRESGAAAGAKDSIEEASLEGTALVLRITDDRGVIEDAELRAGAFELERQTDMKRAGRYSRFLGLVTAQLAADHLGIELVAAEDCLFQLVLSRGA